MKKPKLINSLMKAFNINQVTRVKVDVTDDSYRSISEKELKALMKDIYVPDNQNRSGIVNKLQIPSMLEPIGRELIDRRMDNEKLTSIAPEIEQAASILIPSILSPNDFSKNVFNLVVKGGNESDEVKTKIIELITHHFEEELEISTKLSTWIHEALFNVGCKAIMLLPTTTIGKLRDGIGNTAGSAEGLTDKVCRSLLDEIEGSMESIDIDRGVKKCVLTDDDIIDKAFATGFFNDIILEGDTQEKRDLAERKIRASVKKGTKASIEAFAKLDKIKFSTDPRLVFKPQLSNSAALESIDASIMKKLGGELKPIFRDPKKGIAGNIDKSAAAFNYLPYIDLSEYVFDDKASDFPALIELPGESVIPIIIEGSPDNHIGYFVMLNDNGSPISIDSDNFNDLLSSASGSQRINNLYSAFYGGGQYSLQKKMANDAKVEILNSIYDSFIRNMMHSKLDSMGLDKHSVELSGSISRVMFARLLKNAETRILFVPKKLMLYMAFQYNSDGTGRSKLENIKFPLSLKMTLIIVRLISLIESSINRRNLNITLDEGIGNPIEVLRSIKKDIISNKLYGLSYDPSTIMKSVIDKELTIIPNKIPGVEDFALSDTLNNVEYPRPDDAILDEITNMYTLSLGVPPSAMNRLSEDEFSRTVASNNLFFSNQLKTDQRVVIKFMSSLIVTYILFSDKLKSDIENILKSESNDSNESINNSTENILSSDLEAKKEKVDATTDDLSKKDSDDEEISLATRVYNVINNINFTLPSPNVAQDNAAFEELKLYMEIITSVIEAIFPDDVALDPDVAGVVKVLRANVKRTIIQTHIKDNSLLSSLNFDALANPDSAGTAETTLKLMNFKAALDQAVKVFKTAGEAGSTPTW